MVSFLGFLKVDFALLGSRLRLLEFYLFYLLQELLLFYIFSIGIKNIILTD